MTGYFIYIILLIGRKNSRYRLFRCVFRKVCRFCQHIFRKDFCFTYEPRGVWNGVWEGTGLPVVVCMGGTDNVNLRVPYRMGVLGVKVSKVV